MDVRNNVQSPNFGMALKVKKTPEMAAKLKEQPLGVIEKLKEAGEYLKPKAIGNGQFEKQYYHVYIGEDLTPRLVSEKGSYWGPFGNEIIQPPKAEMGGYDGLKLPNGIMVFRHRGGEVGEMGVVTHNVQQYGFPSTKLLDVDVVAEAAERLNVAARDAALKSAEKTAEDVATQGKVDAEVGSILDVFGV